MLRKGFVIVTVLGCVVAANAADPVKSGPQVGDKVPGPFKPMNATGPDAGKEECQYCKNGPKPVAMVFVRDLNPPTVALIKKLEAAAESNKEVEMGCCVVVLSDAKDLPQSLAGWAKAEKITRTVLATYAPAGPEKYTIASDAAVTVLLYTKFTVKANHSFRTGELADSGVDAVVADVGKIIPKK